MAKVSDLEALALISMLPDDVALTSSEAAVLLRSSPRTMERWRGTGEGPPYIQAGAPGAKGSNQRITYLKKDIRAWQESHRVSNNIEAAVRKGQMFVTLADVVMERPFWRNPKGLIGGLVEDTSVEIFFARLGKWGIEWLPADQVAADTWDSLLSQRTFAAAVSAVLRDSVGKIEAGLEESELKHGIAEASVPSKPPTPI